MLILLLSSLASASPEICSTIKIRADAETLQPLLVDADLSATCTYRPPSSGGGSKGSKFRRAFGIGLVTLIAPPIGLGMAAHPKPSGSGAGGREVGLVAYAILNHSHEAALALIEVGAEPPDDALTWAVEQGQRDLVASWAQDGMQLRRLKLPTYDLEKWTPAVAQLNELDVGFPCDIPQTKGEIPGGYLAELTKAKVPARCQLRRMAFDLPQDDFDRLLPELLRDTDEAYDVVLARQVTALRLTREDRWDDVNRLIEDGLPVCHSVVVKSAFLSGNLAFMDQHLGRGSWKHCSKDDRGRVDYKPLHKAALLAGPAGFDLLDRHGIGPEDRANVVRFGMDVDDVIGEEPPKSSVVFGRDARLIRALLEHPGDEPDDEQLWDWMLDATPEQFEALAAYRDLDEAFVLPRIVAHDGDFIRLVRQGLPVKDAYMRVAVDGVMPTYVLALEDAGLAVDPSAWPALTCAMPRLDIWFERGVPLSDASCASGDYVNLIEKAILSPEYLPLLAERGLDLGGEPGALAMNAMVQRFRGWRRGMHHGDVEMFEAAIKAGVPYTLSLAVLFADECEPNTIASLPPAWRTGAERKALLDAAPRTCRSQIAKATKTSAKR
jgi:hypothetical protein